MGRIAEGRIIKPSYLSLVPHLLVAGIVLLFTGIPGLIFILALIITTPLIGLLVLFAVMGLIALIIYFSILSIKLTSYELRPEGLFIKRGIIAKKQILLLFNQIQDVTEYQALQDRIFGLKQLQLQTMTSSSAMAGRMSGLAAQDADYLKTALLEEINRKSVAGPATQAEQAAVAEDLRADESSANPYPLRFLRMAAVAFIFSAIILTIIGISTYVVISSADKTDLLDKESADDTFDALSMLFWVVIFVIGLPLGLLIRQFTFKYWLGNTTVTIKSGWLSTQRTAMEYAKIQDFLVTRSLFDRILGLAAVRFETGSKIVYTGGNQREQQPNYRIPALSTTDAGQMASMLLKKLDLSYTPNERPLVSAVPLSGTKVLKKTLTASLVLLVLLAIVVGLVFAQSESGPIVLIVGAGILGALILGIIIYQVRYLHNYYYDTSGDTLTVRKGVFGRQQIYLPFSKIQNVFVDQDIFDRICGIYDVHLSTVGHASAHLCHIDGLNRENSDKMMAILLRLIKDNIPRK